MSDQLMLANIERALSTSGIIDDAGWGSRKRYLAELIAAAIEPDLAEMRIEARADGYEAGAEAKMDEINS